MNEKLLLMLIKKDVLRFGEFKLKSGRTSPYFFNAGNITSGAALSAVAEAYADLIVDNKIEFDVIFGPAYKGIPLASATVIELHRKYGIEKRFAYDRKEFKAYGDVKDKAIVGEIRSGDRVILVDDVITTGMAKTDAIEKLHSLGLNLRVTHLLLLFDREEVGESGKSAVKELEEKGIGTHAIFRAREVFDYLKNRKIEGKVYIDDPLYKKFADYFSQFGIVA